MLHENCYTPKIVNPLLHFDHFSAVNAAVVILVVFVLAVAIDKIRIKVSSHLMKEREPAE